MAERQEIRVPDIGDFEDVEVIELLVAPGDEVEVETSLVTLESDKASMEVPSPVAGTIASLEVAIGDKVAEGDLLAVVEVALASAEAEKPDEPAPAGAIPTESAPPTEAASEASPAPGESRAPVASPAPKPAPTAAGAAASGSGDRRPHASPLVRGYARELGVDLASAPGSGREGRVRIDDVRSYVRETLATRGGRGAGEAHHSGTADLSAVIAFCEGRAGDLEIPPFAFVVKAAASALARAGEHAMTIHVLRPVRDAEGAPTGIERLCIDDPGGQGLRALAHALATAAAEPLAAGDPLEGLALLDLTALSGESRPSAASLGADRLLVAGALQKIPVWVEDAEGGARFEPRPAMPLGLSYAPDALDAARAAHFVGSMTAGLRALSPLLL